MFPLLTDRERQQILVDWNDTAVPLPTNQCIHHRFAVQAAQTPDAIALIDGPHQLTYRALNQQANQLAHHLIQQGVQPGDLVGISVNRSATTIIALLGILKAGAAYLPLDPTYPAERLAFMIENAQPQVIITHSSVIGDRLSVIGDQLTINNQPSTINQSANSQFTLRQTQGRLIHPSADSGQANSQFILLDAAWPTIAQSPISNPQISQSPSSLAYIIYTSGSTGKPKGVMIPHHGVLNHNLAVIDLFNLEPADRVWQFATINFDTAVEEIFPTLLTGATLVLRGDDVPPVST
ncbi:MAG: AMP-binding protein, partial [Anaerolineae bacterium]